MNTIHAIFENGAFHPTEPVELPESCEVEFEPRLVKDDKTQVKDMTKIFEILSRRFQSGEHDVAARHNEHQP